MNGVAMTIAASSFSIDGQRLSDLSKALGLGDNPIDTLLERSKKAIAEQAAAAHVKAAAVHKL